MTAARPRALPEWPVHLPVWVLLLVKEGVAMGSTPAFQAPGTVAITAWLLALGYLFVKATA